MTNILFILSDDLGIEQHNGMNQAPANEFIGTPAAQPTLPNIDSIRQNGLRFDRFYTEASCSPTRAAWLTGRFPLRTGMGTIVNANATRQPILEAEITFPELCKRAGLEHQFGLFGKGHISNGVNGGLDALRRMGWDYSAFTQRNITAGSGQSYYDYDYIVNGEERRGTEYVTTWTTDEAIRWIQQQGSKPWFCYVPYHAPHEPLTVPPTGTWDTAAWGNPPNTEQQRFKAMSENLDWNIGRLLSIIDYSDTLVVYCSDNGSPEERIEEEAHPDLGAYPEDYAKGTMFEAGLRNALYMRGGPVANGGDRRVSSLVHCVDLYATFADVLGISDVTTYLPDDRVVDAVSFKADIEDTGTSSRDFIYCEVFRPNGIFEQSTLVAQRMIFDGQYKILSGRGETTLWSDLSNRYFYDLDALAPGQPGEGFETIANSLIDNGDLSGLSTAELAAYNALVAKVEALFRSVDLSFALTPQGQ